MSIIVTTPTIPQRRTTRQLTIHQWAALGLPTITTEQPAEMPICHASQLTTAKAALRAALDHGADTIIYAEDDIDIDPDIVHYLTPTPGTITAAWFRPRFHHGRDTLAPAINQKRWWGGPCLIMGRPEATHLTHYNGKPGIDLALRDSTTVMLPPRPLVEHRALPRAASSGPTITSGGNYQGPDSHHLADLIYTWLPKRRDRKRITTPSIAATNLNISQAEAAWVYAALETMGHIIKDPSGWHQGPPPPWHTTPTTQEGLFQC